jgi:hypothetical protein
MDAENLTAEQVLDACDENTIAVIVTFGQTFTGKFEDVAASALLSMTSEPHPDSTSLSTSTRQAEKLRCTVLRAGHRLGFSDRPGQIPERVGPQDRASSLG